MNRFLRLLPWLLLLCLAGEAGAIRPGLEQTVIKIKGSDTMVELVTNLARAYERKNRPRLRVEVGSGGSASGISSLVNGHVDVATASRPMKPKEMELSKKTTSGLGIGEQVVAWDAMAVFVHVDNPLARVSMKTLREIFGRGGKVQRWSALGVKPPGCVDDLVRRISRRNDSGTYSFFRQALLGENRSFVREMVFARSSREVAAFVQSNPCAIGYAGMPFVGDAVKPLCIGEDAPPDSPCVLPNAQGVVSQTYPLMRPLYFYTKRHPEQPVLDFIQWVLGEEGQKIVSESGFVPLVVP